jgi:hypothetical protein
MMIVERKNQKQRPTVCFLFSKKTNKESYSSLLDIPVSIPITYAPDIPTSYVETVTVKTTTTTLMSNNAVYAKDLLEDIDRVRYC